MFNIYSLILNSIIFIYSTLFHGPEFNNSLRHRCQQNDISFWTLIIELQIGKVSQNFVNEKKETIVILLYGVNKASEEAAVAGVSAFV